METVTRPGAQNRLPSSFHFNAETPAWLRDGAEVQGRVHLLEESGIKSTVSSSATRQVSALPMGMQGPFTQWQSQPVTASSLFRSCRWQAFYYYQALQKQPPWNTGKQCCKIQALARPVPWNCISFSSDEMKDTLHVALTSALRGSGEEMHLCI